MFVFFRRVFPWGHPSVQDLSLQAPRSSPAAGSSQQGVGKQGGLRRTLFKQPFDTMGSVGFGNPLTLRMCYGVSEIWEPIDTMNVLWGQWGLGIHSHHEDAMGSVEFGNLLTLSVFHGVSGIWKPTDTMNVPWSQWDLEPIETTNVPWGW